MPVIALRDLPAKARERHVHGGEFILDGDEEVATVWGTDAEILWASGEGLMLVGGVGAGKSTIIQQVILHGIGVRRGPFLGGAVNFSGGLVGYVAADRPSQIRRSFRRMVTEKDRERLDERLDIWRGPLPFDLARAPIGMLADWVDERGWQVLVVDSLKDVVSATTPDDDALAINRQFQECLARGLEIAVLHHDRKSGAGGRSKKGLDDVFGSRWLTAGFGSVVYVEGEAGSADVELRHLKPIADVVGPWTLHHDHANGVTTRVGDVVIKHVRKPGQGVADALAVLVSAGGSATTPEVAAALDLTERQALNYLRSAAKTGAVVERPRANKTDPITWRVVE